MGDEAMERPLLIPTQQPREPDNVGNQDGCQPSLHMRFFPISLRIRGACMQAEPRRGSNRPGCWREMATAGPARHRAHVPATRARSAVTGASLRCCQEKGYADDLGFP